MSARHVSRRASTTDARRYYFGALLFAACERASHQPPQVHCELRDGTVFCSGNNGFGIVRQPPKEEVVPETVIPLPERASEIALQPLGDFACALGASGAVYCWGNDSYGNLGDGEEIRFSAPTRVVGRANTCALTADHAVYCWGEGDRGSLGRPGDEASGTPLQVLDGGVARLAIGEFESCALRDSGRVTCWGANIAPPRDVDELDDATGIEVRKSDICARRRSGPERCWSTLTP